MNTQDRIETSSKEEDALELIKQATSLGIKHLSVTTKAPQRWADNMDQLNLPTPDVQLSQYTYDQIDIPCKKVDKITVKGKKELITIYQPA